MKIFGVSVMSIVVVLLVFYIGRHTNWFKFVPVLG